jgi:hypothetical protein
VVTVVIPVFNGADYLERTTRSVLAQSFEEFELLVVDDGSTDRSYEVAEACIGGDPRCQVLRHDNAGLAATRKRGLEAAQGRYIAFLDQDDLWYPGFLDRMVAALDSQNELAAVGSLMDYINDDERRLGSTAQTPRVIDQDAVRRGELVPFPPSAMLFRTSHVRDSGAAEDLFGRGLATGADLSLIARTATIGKVGSIREVLCARRVHRSSTLSQSHMEQFAAVAYVQAVLARPGFEVETPWQEFLHSHRPVAAALRYQRAIVRYRQAGQELIDRRWVLALRYFAGAVLLRPDYVIRRAWAQMRGK